MKKLLCGLSILIMVSMVGCNNTEQNNNPNKKHFITITDGYEMTQGGEIVIEIKDKETGVHYIMTSDGISVMYNADGSIKAD